MKTLAYALGYCCAAVSALIISAGILGGTLWCVCRIIKHAFGL